jgi:hypothetical protein
MMYVTDLAEFSPCATVIVTDDAKTIDPACQSLQQHTEGC